MAPNFVLARSFLAHKFLNSSWMPRSCAHPCSESMSKEKGRHFFDTLYKRTHFWHSGNCWDSFERKRGHNCVSQTSNAKGMAAYLATHVFAVHCRNWVIRYGPNSSSTISVSNNTVRRKTTSINVLMQENGFRNHKKETSLKLEMNYNQPDCSSRFWIINRKINFDRIWVFFSSLLSLWRETRK